MAASRGGRWRSSGCASACAAGWTRCPSSRAARLALAQPPVERRCALAADRAVAARLVDAAALAPGDRCRGPALIEGYSSSTWVPPGWTARRDTAGNILLRRRAGMTLDPVDYAIISQSLIAAAREMGAKLVRSAYSTVLREARDGSAALLDAQRQHRGAGRTDPDAARHDRPHLPALRRAVSARDAAGGRLLRDQRPVFRRPASAGRVPVPPDLRRAAR